jgi:alpha-L-arabinofuranosidase
LRSTMTHTLRVLLACCLAAPGLWGQSISQYTPTSGLEASIEIQASETAPFKIPRTVYGTFLEDIGSSIFGGVSAQLLDNPSLESYDASLTYLRDHFSAPEFIHSSRDGLPLPWLPLRDVGMRFEPRWGNAANSDRYLYVMGIPGTEVGIRQAVYLPIERERDYQGVLFAMARESATDLSVSFREHGNPDGVLASTTVHVPPGNTWVKLPFHLSLPPGRVQPLTQVDFAVALTSGQRISLDEIRLYPADAVDGLDPDVIAAAKALHSSLLRYGGNYTSGYHWRDGVGPLDKRPTRLNQSWGYPVFNDFGTDELMKFSELIGARLQLCLNLGSGTPEEARDWVEYLQGPQTSKEGAERAANGHAPPYDVGSYEMGNELWGKWQIGWQTPAGYADRYETFLKAIHGLVPPDTAIYANGADPDHFQDWNGKLLAQDGPDLSYITTHFVVGVDDQVNKSADHDARLKAALAVPLGVAKELAAVKDQIDNNPATRDRVKIAFTEWIFLSRQEAQLPNFTNFGGALLTASWLNMILSHADTVPVSDMTGTVDLGGIHKQRGRVYLTPQCWAFSLYSNYAGDALVGSRTEVGTYDVHEGVRRAPEIPNVPYLDVLATRHSDTGEIALFVVNRDWNNAISTVIRFKDFTPAGAVHVRTLSADAITAQNDEEHPERMRPVLSTLTLSWTELHYAFPAHSLSVLSFATR